MPNRDGTGPGGGGGGRMGGQYAAGPGGNCACPKCGHSEPHQQGQPCSQRVCPQCGTQMARQ